MGSASEGKTSLAPLVGRCLNLTRRLLRVVAVVPAVLLVAVLDLRDGGLVSRTGAQDKQQGKDGLELHGLYVESAEWAKVKRSSPTLLLCTE